MDERLYVTVSAVLRFEDITSGRLLTPDDVTVEAENSLASPVYKQGYFIFTGGWPTRISVFSEQYESIVFTPEPEPGEVIRTALMPVTWASVYSLLGEPGRPIYVYFGTRRTGYALSANIGTGDGEIRLHKNDLHDITNMWHMLLDSQDAAPEPIFITENKGYGRYCLWKPVERAYVARETRLLPLRSVITPPNGVFRIPAPEESTSLWIMDTPGGVIRRVAM